MHWFACSPIFVEKKFLERCAECEVKISFRSRTVTEYKDLKILALPHRGLIYFLPWDARPEECTGKFDLFTSRRDRMPRLFWTCDKFARGKRKTTETIGFKNYYRRFVTLRRPITKLFKLQFRIQLRHLTEERSPTSRRRFQQKN